MRNLSFVLILLVFLTNQACSNEKSGCTNPLAKNYKQIAETDCCCKFDEELAVGKILGSFRLSSKCNSGTSNYDIEITKITSSEDSVKIYNLFNQQSKIGAQFSESSFKGAKTLIYGSCQRRQELTIGLLHEDLILSFSQKKVTGDCGFEIEISCQAVGLRI